MRCHFHHLASSLLIRTLWCRVCFTDMPASLVVLGMERTVWTFAARISSWEVARDHHHLAMRQREEDDDDFSRHALPEEYR